MFGKTDLTKIEKLLRQVVANQNKLLDCWEDTAKPKAEPVKSKPRFRADRAAGVKRKSGATGGARPPTEERVEVPAELIVGTASRSLNIEVSILNYLGSKQAKTASTSALLSRFGGFAYNYLTGKVLMHGKTGRRLNTNKEILTGLLSLMESRELAATTGVRLGRLSVLWGLPEKVASKKRLSLSRTRAILMTTHPEDIQ